MTINFETLVASPTKDGNDPLQTEILNGHFDMIFQSDLVQTSLKRDIYQVGIINTPWYT